MASNDDELILEVRALTGYSGETISDPDMQALIEAAKDEVLYAVGADSLEWYADRSAERSIFWLVALFTKVRTGEVGGAGFTIGELEQVPLVETTAFWLKQAQQHMANITDHRAYGIRSVSRDNRTYGDDL